MAPHGSIAASQTFSPSEILRMRAGGDVADPYEHFVVEEMFAPGFADELLHWLAQCDHWFLSEQKFYEQYEFELASKALPKAIERLTSPGVLAQLISLCEMRFGDPLFRGVSIAAHKLIANQYIGVHNDAPSAEYGMETHRLVVQLNHGQGSLKGGELQLFSQRKAPEPSRSYAPLHNAGFGFRLTPKSYHAVSRVERGERYSLIFTFRRAGDDGDECILRDLSATYRERLFFAEPQQPNRGLQ